MCRARDCEQGDRLDKPLSGYGRNMEKKIIIMSNLDIWSIGEGKGAPSFYNTIKAYVDDDWDVTLIQPKSRFRKDYQVEGCRIVKFNFFIFDLINQIPKVRFFFRFLASPCLTWLFYRTAKRVLAKKGCCVLYAYEVDAVMAGKKLSRKFGYPLVTRFQGTILKDYANTQINRLKKHAHFLALEQKSDMIIMTDDGTQGDQVLKRLGNSTERVYFWKNGQTVYDHEEAQAGARARVRTQHGIPAAAPVLLTVSRLRHWKKVDRAINAMPQVLKFFPECRLVIVGDGDEYNRLVKLAENLGIMGSVVFAGAVEQERVWEYYCIADVFLSLYDLSNVGNPLMEAMRHGKAILTLDVGDTNMIIKDEKNGILLRQDQLDRVAEAVARLLSDSDLRQKIGNSAREYAREHFWTWDERMQAEINAVNAMRNEFTPGPVSRSIF